MEGLRSWKYGSGHVQACASFHCQLKSFDTVVSDSFRNNSILTRNEVLREVKLFAHKG